MTAWRWVRADLTYAVHDRQLAEHGGPDGVRDKGAVELALARPQNLDVYADAAAPASARRAQRVDRLDAADGRDNSRKHRGDSVQCAAGGGAIRARIRRSSPIRSTLWNASRVRASRLAGAARSNMPAASLPSRLGAR